MEPQKAIDIIKEYIENTDLDRHYQNDRNILNAFDEAIEALEKQIPMKQTEEYDITGRPIKVCGYCGDVPRGGWDYCTWCGQKQDV